MPKRKVSALLCTTLRCGDALSCKVIASPPLAGLLHARHAVYMEGARHEAGGSRGRGHLLGSLAARQHASRCLSRRWLHGPQSVTVLLAAYRRQAGAACDDIWFERPKTSACVRRKLMRLPASRSLSEHGARPSGEHARPASPAPSLSRKAAIPAAHQPAAAQLLSQAAGLDSSGVCKS